MQKMRTLLIYGLWLCSLSVSSITANAEAANKVTIELPPESIGQWYKPIHQRQAWLHVMFNLRREMQALAHYAALGEQELAIKWATKLQKDYTKASEMVPEWKPKMQTELADQLLQAVKNNKPEKMAELQRQLGSKCRNCHDKYQAVTAAIYRSADFSGITIENEETMELLDILDTMDGLSVMMNRVVIALADQRFEQAQTAQKNLAAKLALLGQSCSQCHTDDAAKDYILGAANDKRFKVLEGYINKKDNTKAGKMIGEIAVTTCARCHGIHRTAAALGDELLR